MDEQQPKQFLTKDLALATALMTDGVKFLKVEKEEATQSHRKLAFIFEYSSEIDRIQLERTNGTHIVSSIHYESCSRQLKSIIHNSI